MFEPIAIVGRACVLPGALSPEQLWEKVLAGQDLVSNAPSGRWGVSRSKILSSPQDPQDHAWSDRGGYVEGFEQVFDPQGFELSATEIGGLDPLFQWLLHTGRQALSEVRGAPRRRTGVVVGNLGFPSSSMSRYAETVWLGDAQAQALGIPKVDARNRFMSGLPAHLLAQALGLGGPAFALDAACASSLYALKLACDRLQDREADLMLAGAVNRSDDLFIHVGFCALSAMSKTGRSRPFHAQADGLVPGEGAGILALKRLSDAQRDGDTIHGVIRGVGLSNDGRGRGLLAPSSAGQVRAMESAFTQSGWTPTDVTLLECHATGTTVGDGTELDSMSQVYASCQQLPIGSLKSNMGHLITAAGVAGIIKVLEAMRHGQRPPTLHVEQPHPKLSGGPFRLLTAAEPWDGPRRAGVSAFGFGGNNAHVLLEQSPSQAPSAEPSPSGPIAVVGLGTLVGDTQGLAGFSEALESGVVSRRGEQVALPLKRMRFPPNDLKQALGQQTALLAAAEEAVQGLTLPPEKTSVLVGMGTDPNVCRYGARWRSADWAPQLGMELSTLREAFVPVLEAAGVLGTMPNIPANRLNSQLDLGGPSMVVCSEELSGLRALNLAARALRKGETDAAVVGAVDLCSDPVHTRAALSLGQREPGGDAAVVVVLKRLEDAQAAGDKVLAVLDEADAPPLSPDGLRRLVGHTHAAEGLLLAAAAILDCMEGRREGALLDLEALGGQRESSVILSAGTQPIPEYQPEGPLLRLPLHLPEIQLPKAAAAMEPQPMSESALSPSGVQTMAPAPVLPSVMSAGAEPPRPPVQKTAVQKAAALPPAAPMPQPIAPQQPVVPQVQAPVGGAFTHPQAAQLAQQLAAQQRMLTQVHQQFLAQQAEVQQRFLGMRQRALQTLVGAAGSPLMQAAQVAAPTQAQSVPTPALHAPRSPATPSAPAAPRVQAPVPSPVVGQVAKAVNPPAPKAQVPLAPVPAKAPAPKPAPKAAAKAEPAGFKDPKHPWRTDPMAPPVPFRARPKAEELPGLKLDRDGLMVHAGGKISEIYGEQFKPQDDYVRQCRMPLPPLLLADRLLGIDAEAGSMGRGTLWTETDVTEDAWYLHQGRMPAGIMIESGQADLMLISYLGIDLQHQGDRIYRLLGCTLTYHDSLPQPGETLTYDIHVDGHAKHGDKRLFFFHYDCRVEGKPRLTVRQGQAGFFTDAELLESGGILWTAEEGECVENPRMDEPDLLTTKRSLSNAELVAFSEGRTSDCFGPEFYLSDAHTRTPRISGGKMLYLDEVTDFVPKGGPWGRGYLRAIDKVHPTHWFFEGHFHNDPCMPGNLMFEGCLQAMAVYMAGLGFTVDRDGWRFEPVPEEPYKLLCRGQVDPSSQELVYEIFVEEIIAGPEPTIYADMLCTVDGLKAFHCRRMGLRLVPSWPLDSREDMPADHEARGVVKQAPSAALEWTGAPLKKLDTPTEPFQFDYRSLLACAWSRPSKAFGPMYETFDSTRRVARLPGPPYHFMSRVSQIDGTLGGMSIGDKVVLDYDIPEKAWYFLENGAPTMPFCVLLEAALQPCGWLASFVGSALTVENDLFFRNLDGTGDLKVELLPTCGTLRTEVTITNISQSAGMIIESFKVDCFLEHEGEQVHVYDLKTVFGFFPKVALDNQKGLPILPEHKAVFDAEYEGEVVDLDRYKPAGAPLARPYLRMIDKVTGRWPEGGQAGLGAWRAEKAVDTKEWFFKAHFFQDPVQPGSLGIEALLQLAQFAMQDLGMDAGIEQPRFEPVELGRPMSWKYRGQVRTFNKLIGSTIEITEKGTDDAGNPFIVCKGSLWVDGMRIYETENMGMKVVSGAAVKQPGGVGPAQMSAPTHDVVLDPDGEHAWLRDHCPTWTVPAAPMMWMVDRIAQVAFEGGEGRLVLGVQDVAVKRWLVADAPTKVSAALRYENDHIHVTLSDEDGVVCTGRAHMGWEPLAGEHGWPALEAAEVPSPYAAGTLFHGPLFQLQESLRMGDGGSSAVLRVTGAIGSHWDVALLDAATHGIPHDDLSRWSAEIPEGMVAYPAFIPELRIHGATPKPGSEIRCEVRFDGFHGSKQLPRFKVQLVQDGGWVWCSFTLVESLFPKGPLGSFEPEGRRRFLRDRKFVPGLSLSEGGVLKVADVDRSNWLPGTVETLYGTADASEVALAEAIAAEVQVHPYRAAGALPLNPIEATQEELDDGWRTTARIGPLKLDPVVEFWSGVFDRDPWPVEDLYYGLIQRFVRRVVTPEPEALEAVQGRSLLYLGNHQTGVESLLFSIVASGLTGVPTVTLAKAEHRHTWLGKLIAHNFSYPGVTDPRVIQFFDRDDKASLPKIIGELAAEMAGPGKSVMVHVEGTRSLNCRTPVQKMSGAFIDMALKVNAPIVPVRFVGGLPAADLEARVEFPVGLSAEGQEPPKGQPFAHGLGQQDIWLGAPILPEDIAHLPYGERKRIVIDAINGLGPANAAEAPFSGDLEFGEKVEAWRSSTGATHEHATLLQVLREAESVCPETQAILDGLDGSGFQSEDSEAGAWLAELARRLYGEQGPPVK
ncbi:MAG: beta-ketoacyl synthase N-terminal-like domain-containing protein [Myxococcota bacterium]|nr:beta-ketoacyl synthase N-terminal-like domain-containing protein [Myxococcota bacterium]